MAVDAIITKPFRLAFPEVFQPKASVQGGAEKYSITLLFPKDGSSLIPGLDGKEAILDIQKLLYNAAVAKWGQDRSKWPANLKAINPRTYLSPTGQDGWPLRDGDTVDWDGFAGHVFVRASSKFAPGMVDAKLQAILDKSAVFGGLICRAQVNAYDYDKNGKKGVTLGLNNIQILKDDGTSFGAANAADVFDAFGDPNADAAGFGADPMEDAPF